MRVADTNEKRLPMTHPAGPDSVPGARVCQKQRRTKGRQRTWTKYRVPMKHRKDVDETKLAVQRQRGTKRQNEGSGHGRKKTANDARRAFHTGRTAKAKYKPALGRGRNRLPMTHPALRLRARRTGLPKAKEKRKAKDVDKIQSANDRHCKDVEENELPMTVGQRQRRALLQGCWGWLLFRGCQGWLLRKAAKKSCCKCCSS